MSANAYVLITVEPARTEAIRERLQAIPGSFIREVLGPFDFIVEIEADTPEDITHIMRSKIRSIPGVTSTITCPWS